jgi:threonine dehydratase
MLTVAKAVPTVRNAAPWKAVAALHRTLAPHLRWTPLLYSQYFSDKLGCHLYLKLENLQHTGSFKARGALAKALSLSPAARAAGFVAASGGNHGLGVCHAARTLRTTALIFLPRRTPQCKVEEIRRLGGEVVLAGDVFDEAHEAALSHVAEHGGSYLHPFDDDEVIDGQATVAHEIVGDLPRVDVVVCSVGGGGLISGLARYLRSRRPGTRIYGVETHGAHSMDVSLRAGRVVPLPAVTSVAESLATRAVAERTLRVVERLVDGHGVVTDAHALRLQTEILQKERLLVEPAASCTLASLEAGHVPDLRGKHVVAVMCGGNFAVERLTL